MTGGDKHDQGKLQWDLLPLEGLTELAQVYQFGAKKYGPDNWRRGLSYRRCFSALMRHVVAWARGEDRDSESQIHHLAHAAFYCLAVITYGRLGSNFDDRRT